jgi:uroporphyrinogen-III synthase
VLSGWDAGFQTIDLMRLITEATDLGLIAAKALVERVVAGEVESLSFSSREGARKFCELARKTGVHCRIDTDVAVR